MTRATAAMGRADLANIYGNNNLYEQILEAVDLGKWNCKTWQREKRQRRWQNAEEI